MKKTLIILLMTLMLPKLHASDFTVKSTLAYLKDVAIVADCVLKDPDFIKEVNAHGQFDYTKDISIEVARKIVLPTPVVISTYKKRFTKSIAYRNVGSNVLYFNTMKNPRSMKEMVNTLSHERLHVVGYGHGSNSSKGKENSVNYSLGKLSEKYVDRCNTTSTK